MLRLLLIHPEATYFGGAETMLRYFLSGLEVAGCEVAVAAAPGSRVGAELPAWVRRVWIPNSGRFSLVTLLREAWKLSRWRREFDYQVVHGWAARDWELTAFLGRMSRRATVGTLHDHPASHYIRGRRRSLMRLCANQGLQRIVCVSEAVRAACVEAGYRAGKLTVIHNGLPHVVQEPRPALGSPLRLGYLGAFTRAKGFDVLFRILAELDRRVPGDWEVRVAGKAPDQPAETLTAELGKEFGGQSWWQRVHWEGWTDQPAHFLRNLDLLVFPATRFDS
ncbi:MAG: glycosyltransferase, partial [Verrucomicrobia bacterium]|nr:glycosyltransferase [Verrucomicrobiota bacterium]